MARKQKRSLLSADQEELLDRLLAEEGLLEDGPFEIPVGLDAQPVPLTYAQSRIWLLEGTNPTNSRFLIPTAIRLPAAINPTLLNEAFQSVCQRHAILQATIYEEKGALLQKAGNRSPLPLTVIDLSSLAKADQEKVMLEKIREESRRPFNVKTDPYIRLTLLCMAPEENVLVLVTHHIVSDAWSIDILLAEMIQTYLQLLQGQAVDLPDLPIQYTDYAAWQQEWLTSDEAARQLAYWRDQLQGAPPHTELPADFARPPKQTFDGAQLRMLVPATLHDKLSRLSQAEGTTLFVTLLTAFKILLKRHIGQDEIVVGSPVAGRTRPELEPLVGLFLNTLVLRTNLQGTPTFLEVLDRVRRTCVGAFANQEIPFEILLAELMPSRDASRTPFFQIFFNMIEFDPALRAKDTAAQSIPPQELSANFDLTLYLEEGIRGIDLTLVYNRDLFSAAHMEEILHQYLLLLQQIADDPVMSINRYSLLTDSARATLPDPSKLLSSHWAGSIFARLDQWAGRQGEKIALTDAGTQWTYAQVAAASSRLAQFLYQNGVQAGDVVAIYGWRCAALVPAIMGVLKAGAVVLILDPKYPEARLEQYLRLAKPVGWLSFKDLEASQSVKSTALRTAGSCQRQLPLQPEMFLEELALYPEMLPPIAIGPDDKACLTFTSGSTGRSKAIVGRHGSLTHFYPWMVQRFKLSESDRFSMLSGLAHDPLQREIFTAIWVGAEICIPEPEQMLQPGFLINWLRATGVTVTHLVPSMMYILTYADDLTPSSSLRLAFFVGESLMRHMASQLKRIFPAVTIVNMYGTSETQRAVSYHMVSTHTPGRRMLKQEISLGKGMPGAQLLVLTPNHQLAGVGELGEICVRSPHLALGYLENKETTLSRFIQNPWGDSAGDKVYRTGDFGRYLPDGQVLFAGRKDTQINILGLRSELSEIESVLTAHPAINAVVVTVLEQSGNHVRLAAYIVKERQSTELSGRQVQNIVKENLPLPILPTDIIFLDEIPLTPNGKIDYNALPDPNFVASAYPQSVAPRDPIEETLLVFWQELLPVRNISVHDDFFALGGHSILAVQLFSRIRDKFNIELNIGLLFRYASIAELAQIIRETAVAGSTAGRPLSSNLLEVRAGRPGEPLLFVVHGAGGHVMFMQQWQKFFEGWSLYGLESPGVDGISWPNGSLKSVVSGYVAALESIPANGPVLLAGYSGGGVYAYEMARQLTHKGKEVELLILIDTYHPAVRSRPHTWSERWAVFSQHPLQTLKGIWQRKVSLPFRVYDSRQRFVKRGKRVPFELRQPILEYSFAKTKASYQPKPYDGPALLVRSLQVIPVYDHVDDHFGWNGLLSDLQIIKVPGNHFDIVQEPNLRYLVEAIEKAWNHIRAQRTIPSD